MARTSKEPQAIPQRELAEAAITLADIAKTLQLAAESIPEGDVLYVVYGKSLERGMASLEAVSPQIRKAVALKNAGLSQREPSQNVAQPRKTVPNIPGTRTTSAAELAAAEDRAKEERRERKNPTTASVGRKKKATRKSSTQAEVDAARKSGKKPARKKASGE